MTSRGFLLRLLVLSGGLLGAALMGELASRLGVARFLPAPNPDLIFDPQLGWKQRSGQASFYLNESGSRVRVEGGSLGIRRPESGYSTASGVRNILVVGDSFVAGTQLPFRASWPALLSERLRRADPTIQVVNAGVDGYDLAQSFWMMRRLWPRFEPRCVIVGVYVGNDLLDYSKDSVALPPWRPTTLRNVLRDHSYFYHLLARYRPRLSRSQDNPVTGAREVWTPRSVPFLSQWTGQELADFRRQFEAPTLMPVLRGDATSRKRLQSTERILDTFRNAIRASGSGLVVVLFPIKQQVISKQLEEWTAFHGLSEEQAFLAQRELLRWAARENVAMVDLTEALRDVAFEEPFWRVDLHLSPAGHAAVAEALATIAPWSGI